MLYNIDDISEDLKANKKIWRSPKSFWWTSNPKDLEEATHQGIRFNEHNYNKMVEAGTNTPEHDDFMRIMRENIKSKNKTIILDPIGCPIDIEENGNAFFNSTVKFLKEKTIFDPQLIIFAHHRNCKFFCFSDWTEYGELFDMVSRHVVAALGSENPKEESKIITLD